MTSHGKTAQTEQSAAPLSQSVSACKFSGSRMNIIDAAAQHFVKEQNQPEERRNTYSNLFIVLTCLGHAYESAP